MLWVNASLVVLLAGMLLAALILLRRAQFANDMARQLHDAIRREQTDLRELIVAARRESERLEAAIARSAEVAPRAPGNKLALLEALAEASSLADPDAMAHAAEQILPLPGGAANDLFESNETDLALARLLNQGHSPNEIARRLGLPLGEVELRLSLRPA
jgi:DNA-binding NarL/FixJ family response regulator